jgi:hypothetical protein
VVGREFGCCTRGSLLFPTKSLKLPVRLAVAREAGSASDVKGLHGVLCGACVSLACSAIGLHMCAVTCHCRN